MVVVTEPGQVNIVVVGDRTALEQQPGDRRVDRTGDRAAQRCPAAGSACPPDDAGPGVGSGVQERPGHRQQAVGPGRVEPVPSGGAGQVQRRPARPGIGPGRPAGVPADLLAYPADVAEDHRGGEAVAGDLRRGRQHPDGAAGPVADAGDAERLRLPGQVSRAGGDLGLEPGPAREAVLAGQGQLRAGQGQRARYRPDAADRGAVAGLRVAQQVPGLAAQVIEAGPGRKVGHDVSFTGLRSARQAGKGDRRELLP